MRRFVDLHTHSSASDGQFAPEELIRAANSLKLAAIGLTDHDTVAGLAAARAAAANCPEMRFAPGLEISARFPDGTMHVLAYGIDENAAAIQRVAERYRAARDRRNPQIIARLQQMGLAITMADVLAAAPQVSGEGPRRIVSRVHIAQALRQNGCVRTQQEAFDNYIGKGAPAYVEKETIDPGDAIDAIHRAGGVAVLAHPVQLGCHNRAELERIVRGLKSQGLDGIEVYHSDHTPAQTRAYLDVARRCGLGITGGSDFHGGSKPDSRLGRPRVPLAAISEEFASRIFAIG